MVKAMDPKVSELARQLLESGFDRFSDREKRVITRIAGRLHVTRDVNRAIEANATFSDWLADRVARFGGSWTFIVIFIGTMALWTIINTAVLSRHALAFDAYPYIFLNLILSMVAALQAPIILMSQNRQAERDRLAASLDYEVNLKAEIEIMNLHEKLDQMRIGHLEEMISVQQRQLQSILDAVGRIAAAGT
jgi:uncharacterized membrane protein